MRIYTILTITVLLAGILTSCKKDNNNITGTPVISKVTTSLDHNDSIQEGALNQWVVIHGLNFSGTEKVSFDDLEIDPKDMYVRDTLISAKIPRQIPSVITHKITVVTKSGTATYDFSINLPPLKFTRLKNEYANEGELMDIEGENFDLYFVEGEVTVTFAGGATANIEEFTPERIRILVPAGAEVGPITIKGGEPLHSEIITNSSWYKDNRNLILIQPVLEPAAGLVTSHPDFPNNPGPMLIKQGDYPAWAWDTFLSAYITYPPDAAGENVTNYVMKFEINTKTPINKGDIIFRLGNNNYYRWPYNFYGVMINTNNEWETMTIPLNLIAIDPSDHAYIQLILSDGEARTNNFAMTNFRIVPKN